MKMHLPRMLALSILGVSFSLVNASAQNIATNQTFGYGNAKLLKFTYTQNFDCVDQPKTDLDFNGKKAASDPNEMQIPICQVGTQPTINPPGVKGNPKVTTEPLYVLVPMFSVDNDQNPADAISCDGVVPGTLCGPALGKTLIALFGAVPEAFKAKPLVYSQCPDGNLPPGTCTMHSSRLDLGPALEALKILPPPTGNVFVPTPNHSHVVNSDAINVAAIWWQVLPVLVFNQSDWPPKDGNSGLTSDTAIDAAVKSGAAIEADSNFFLFFSSHTAGHGEHEHEGK